MIRKKVNRRLQKLLEALFPARASLIANLILPYLKDKDIVLDLGAGSGKVTEAILAKKHLKLIPLDVADRCQATYLEIQRYDGEKIPFKTNYFDCVLLVFVLHHCEEPDLVLKEAVRVTKNKILVFEDKIESKVGFFLLKIWHTVVSILIGEDLFYSFRKDRAWQKKFKKLGLKVRERRELRLPFYKPTKQILYVLEK